VHDIHLTLTHLMALAGCTARHSGGGTSASSQIYISHKYDADIGLMLLPEPAFWLAQCAAVTGAFLHHSNKTDQDKKLGIVRKGNALDQCAFVSGIPPSPAPFGCQQNSQSHQPRCFSECMCAASPCCMG